MDCLHAQQLLSEAVDGELVDAARLAEAKGHCAACADCTAFTRGLLALRVPGPPAPESLIAAVVSRVEAEAAQRAAADAARAAAEATALAGAEAATGGGDTPAAPTARPRPSKWRTAWGISAAAAIVIGFALLTQYGIGLMTDPFGTGQSAREASSGSPVASPEAVPPDAALGGAPKGQEGARSSYDAAAKAPAYVSFRDHVYRLQGARETSDTPVTVIGTVRTARDGVGAANIVQVYNDPSNPNGLLLPAQGEGTSTSYVAFTPVTRNLKGRIYVLSFDDDIARFGDWPKLPAEYPEPASPDGSPIFFEGGADDAGVKIYVPRGRDAEKGFAVGPSMPPSDATSGNPNWTWWEPLD